MCEVGEIHINSILIVMIFNIVHDHRTVELDRIHNITCQYIDGCNLLKLGES